MLKRTLVGLGNPKSEEEVRKIYSWLGENGISLPPVTTFGEWCAWVRKTSEELQRLGKLGLIKTPAMKAEWDELSREALTGLPPQAAARE